MKYLIIQPHSDDALICCSHYLFNEECVVLTIENNPKRIQEDNKVSEIINAEYKTLSVDIIEEAYSDYFKEYGKDAVLTEDDVLVFFANRLGLEKIEKLSLELNNQLEEYRSKGYQIICPMGVGHPFHFLVRILITNQKGFIYYREFAHSYKRRAKRQFETEMQNLTLVLSDDNKDNHDVKFEVAQKCYKSQSGFFFYELGYIKKDIPEEFYKSNEETIIKDNKMSEKVNKGDKRMQIYVISKGRPNGKTFTILQKAKFPYKVVVEPQDYESYKKAGHKDIVVLPENDRGISYTMNYSKNQYDGYNPLVIMDDDIMSLYLSLKGVKKCSYSMKTDEEFYKFFQDLNDEVCSTDFDYGTIGKSAFDWNTEDVSPRIASPNGKIRYFSVAVVAIINNPILTKFDYDESLCIKQDWDFSLKCMYLDLKVANFIRFLQQTKMNKDLKQKGGLIETYKKTDEIRKSHEMLLERWKDNIKVDNKKVAINGVSELRVDYRKKEEPACIKELKKFLQL